jgi:hypothetical protein
MILGPDKPAEGAPCNGCGVCCISALCGLAALALHGPEVTFLSEVCGEQLAGPCPILEWEDGRAWCGFIRHPERYPDFRKHLPPAVREMSTHDLLSDRGCDSRDRVGARVVRGWLGRVRVMGA